MNNNGGIVSIILSILPSLFKLLASSKDKYDTAPTDNAFDAIAYGIPASSPHSMDNLLYIY
jgi:hypothetical protein